jgi:hypothetical protein
MFQFGVRGSHGLHVTRIVVNHWASSEIGAARSRSVGENAVMNAAIPASKMRIGERLRTGHGLAMRVELPARRGGLKTWANRRADVAHREATTA